MINLSTVGDLVAMFDFATVLQMVFLSPVFAIFDDVAAGMEASPRRVVLLTIPDMLFGGVISQTQCTLLLFLLAWRIRRRSLGIWVGHVQSGREGILVRDRGSAYSIGMLQGLGGLRLLCRWERLAGAEVPIEWLLMILGSTTSKRFWAA